MVRFIRYWIEHTKESPEAREAKTRAHLEKMSASAEDLKSRWAQTPKPAGYWTSSFSTSTTKDRLSKAQADIIQPYERALADLIESEKRNK